jgi:SAM-dependent methyltransferase
MQRILKSIQYYFWATYRRKILDRLLEEHKACYKGTVLDIGGRDRGKFRKPRNKVERWIFADVEERHNPDIVLNVEDMGEIASESIDVINAIELFEHVERPEQALKQCYRVLRRGGVMVVSVPFLYPVHADPYDFQRWAQDKWRKELDILGFKIQQFRIMGRFFTVLADLERTFVKSMPRLFRWPFYLLYPLLDLLAKLDELASVIKHPLLGRFHGGYFIVAQK